jgi:hypothetical protein
MGVDRYAGRAHFAQSWNEFSYVEGDPLAFVDPNGLELQAFYLTTGAANDLTLHSAIYFRDSEPGKEVDVVFSRGGMANGVNTLAAYLSHYDSISDPTTAYRLKLSTKEAHGLFEQFKADWELRNILVFAGPEYNAMTNNCAQYACRKIISVGSNWDSIRGILSETVNVEDKVDPTAPVLLTSSALSMLRFLGYLGGVEKGLQPPAHAPANVTAYWSYYPPKP